MRWEVAATTLLLLLFCGSLAYRTEQTAQKEAQVQAKQLASVAKASIAPVPTMNATSSPVLVPILIYHSVRPDFMDESKSQEEYSVTPEVFDAQLRYLKENGYTVVSLDDLVRFVTSGTTTVNGRSIAKPVVITLDDGWQNQYDYAFPLLKKYGDTATFFIFTNPIGKDKRFVTWPEAKEMLAAGMTIGDHTVDHPYMNHLTQEELHREIFDSKAVLEQELGVPILHFASPFGQMTPALEETLKEAGFTTGRTTSWGSLHSSKDLLHLPGYQSVRSMQMFAAMLARKK